MCSFSMEGLFLRFPRGYRKEQGQVSGRESCQLGRLRRAQARRRTGCEDLEDDNNHHLLSICSVGETVLDVCHPFYFIFK